MVALGVKLIGLRPLFSGVTAGGPLGDAPVPLILATLLPKKLPIPLPIPPNVDRISAKGGLVGPLVGPEFVDCPPSPVTGVPVDVLGAGVMGDEFDGTALGSFASFSLRMRSASSRSFILVAIPFLAPSNARKRDEEPVANADEPAANALFSTSRVGARD